MISFSFLIFIDDNLPGFGVLTSKVSKKNKLKQKKKKRDENKKQTRTKCSSSINDKYFFNQYIPQFNVFTE